MVLCCKSRCTRDHCSSLTGVGCTEGWPHTSSSGKQSDALTPLIASIRRGERIFSHIKTRRALSNILQPRQGDAAPQLHGNAASLRPKHNSLAARNGISYEAHSSAKKNRWLRIAASSGLHSPCLLVLLCREVTGSYTETWKGKR